MSIRTKEQQDLLTLLQGLEINDLHIYIGTMSFQSVRTNINQWVKRKRLFGVFKSFVWDNKLYIIRVRPKDAITNSKENRSGVTSLAE